ncbi:MSMEG_0565 family glycosyltransferase [Massilia sp. TN1-12]|uniref:MSMEG_0565 family glycosyltransferase n=1 Tax=Massilia paldalensis TaxID=3377675 RepID=UPI003850400C
MDAALRIALLTHSTNPRGGVVHAIELGDALHALGQLATVLAPDPHGRGLFREPRCGWTGVPAHAVNGSLVARVRQAIDDYVAWFERADTPRFDIYHAQDSISANALAVLRTRGVIPGFVRTVHHLDDFDDPQLAAWQERGYRDADRVLCVSRLWHETLAREHGIAALQVANGVDLARWTPTPNERDPALRLALGLGPGPVVLAVGGVEPRKNTLRILQAFLLLRARLPHAQLVIAGGASLLDHGAYVEEFEAQAAAAGLARGPGRALQVLGRVDDMDMPALLRCADVLAFPSLREGFGLVVLEAMASGTPVVVPRIAPFTDYLPADACAWAEPGDPASIAAALLAACDPSTAARLRARGAAVCAEHGWHRSAVRHLAIYRAFLATPSHGAPHA